MLTIFGGPFNEKKQNTEQTPLQNIGLPSRGALVIGLSDRPEIGASFPGVRYADI